MAEAEKAKAKAEKPEVDEGPGWRWVRVSDEFLDEMRGYGEPVKVKVEDGPEEGEVILTFQRIEEGR